MSTQPNVTIRKNPKQGLAAETCHCLIKEFVKAKCWTLLTIGRENHVDCLVPQNGVDAMVCNSFVFGQKESVDADAIHFSDS
jgi:hypothetical protein